MPRKKKSKIQKNLELVGKGVSLKLLELVQMLGDGYTSMIMDHYHRGYPKDVKIYSNTVYSSLNRMRKQGLVKVIKTKGQTIYKITQTGKLKLLMNNISKLKRKATDGFSTVVSFDIPEDKAAGRRFLRSFLLKNGFINIQKSVMIGPYEITKDFFDMLTELKIRQYVTVLKSKVIYL